MKILLVSPWYPDPPDNGAKLRLSNLLSALCGRHRVSLIAAHDPGHPPSSKLRKPLTVCEKVVSVPWIPRPRQGVWRILSYLWSRPEWVFPALSSRMEKVVCDQLRSEDYDLIIGYHLSTAHSLLAQTMVPKMLEEIQLAGYLDSVETDSVLRRARRRVFAWKLRRALRSLLRRVTACTVPSVAERDLLIQFVPQAPPVAVIPNCLDPHRYQGFSADPQPHTLIFTGALTFQANRDAVQFFLQSIYPLIKRDLPQVRLCITGRRDGVSLPLIEDDQTVRMTGFVDDVRPFIAGSWVSIVPLLTGGGTRYKILEAMALGTPVVSTSKGAEGLRARPGNHLLIADRPERFAAAVVQLCEDPALRARLSTAGRHLVAEHYTWQSTAPRYLDWVERAALDGAAQVD